MSLREKCPNTEFCLVRIFCPEKTTADTFHAVCRCKNCVDQNEILEYFLRFVFSITSKVCFFLMRLLS